MACLLCAVRRGPADATALGSYEGPWVGPTTGAAHPRAIASRPCPSATEQSAIDLFPRARQWRPFDPFEPTGSRKAVSRSSTTAPPSMRMRLPCKHASSSAKTLTTLVPVSCHAPSEPLRTASGCDGGPPHFPSTPLRTGRLPLLSACFHAARRKNAAFPRLCRRPPPDRGRGNARRSPIARATVPAPPPARRLFRYKESFYDRPRPFGRGSTGMLVRSSGRRSPSRRRHQVSLGPRAIFPCMNCPPAHPVIADSRLRGRCKAPISPVVIPSHPAWARLPQADAVILPPP